MRRYQLLITALLAAIHVPAQRANTFLRLGSDIYSPWWYAANAGNSWHKIGTGGVEFANSVLHYDSLRRFLPHAPNDTTKVNMLLELAKDDYGTSSVQRIHYLQNAKHLSDSLHYTRGHANALDALAFSYSMTDKILLALDLWYDALKEFEQLKDNEGKANVLSGIADLFVRTSNFREAVRYTKNILSVVEKMQNKRGMLYGYSSLISYYKKLGQYDSAIGLMHKAIPLARSIQDSADKGTEDEQLGELYAFKGDYNAALQHYSLALKLAQERNRYLIDASGEPPMWYAAHVLNQIGKLYLQMKDYQRSLATFQQAYKKLNADTTLWPFLYMFPDAAETVEGLGMSYYYLHNNPAALLWLFKLDGDDMKGFLPLVYLRVCPYIIKMLERRKDYAKAYQVQTEWIKTKAEADSIENEKMLTAHEATAMIKAKSQLEQLNSEKVQHASEMTKVRFENKLRTMYYSIGAVVLLLTAGILLWSNRRKQRVNKLLNGKNEEIQKQKDSVEQALQKLRVAQARLVQQEKMASLGELTAGIAHEIQNPLNFVNNFSDVTLDILDEAQEEMLAGHLEDARGILGDAKVNIQKIAHHGRRADTIVKSMMEHSQSSKGELSLTDLNALTDEYNKLAYQSFKAKEPSFDAQIETHYDPNIGKLNLLPQDIGRVLLNLFNNAFYSVLQKKELLGAAYVPVVQIRTAKNENRIEVFVKDNGIGIPEKVLPKIFQPFFTTKPTGEGTGLGLSLSYDIVTKGHGGEIRVESKEGEGAEFIVSLPV